MFFRLSSDEEEGNSEEEPDKKKEGEGEEEEEQDVDEEAEMDKKLAELKAEEVAELKRYDTKLVRITVFFLLRIFKKILPPFVAGRVSFKFQ